MNNNRMIIVLGAAFAFILLVVIAVSAMAYSNVSGELTSAQDEMQRAREEQEDLRRRLDAKDKEISELKAIQEAKEDAIKRGTTQIQALRRDIDTVGNCLKGVVGVMSAVGNDNPAQLIMSLSGLKEPCEKSDRILQNIQKESGTNL